MSLAVAVWMRLPPREGRADDRMQIVETRFPARLVFNPLRVGNQHGRISGAAERLADRHLEAGHGLDGGDDLQDGVAPTPLPRFIGDAASVQLSQGAEMRLGEVRDMGRSRGCTSRPGVG